MAASKPDKAAERLLRTIRDRGLDYVRIGVTDLDGVLRGKFMHRAKLEGALAKGFGFCDVVLGWDSADQPYDNVSLTGWHTGFPDATVRVLPQTMRDAPFDFDGKGILVLGEFTGAAEAICPRGLLRRVIARGLETGFRCIAGLEYEFFLFDETPRSVREKRYRDLTPLTPGSFGYSSLRTAALSELYTDLLDLAQRMDFALEGLHTETGPGVMEAAIDKTEALAAADKAALFKTFTKVWAQRHGKMATFMAKWSPDQAGQSGHLHMSLRGGGGRGRGGAPGASGGKGDRAVFHDAKAEGGISQTMRHFIGGQQALMPEFLALVAPTVNAFRRMIPGFWAPTAATWGIDNRTCALRAVPAGEAGQRVEYRIAAADGNPYLVLAAALASGLHGIAEQTEPGPPAPGNAYDLRVPSRLRFAPSLEAAAERLRRSAAARDWFGDAFVEHFAASRDWEARAFRQAITDWELERYFEII